MSKLSACKRCFGGGEVLSNTIPRWGDRHPGAFSPCPDCKGRGRSALSEQPEVNRDTDLTPPTNPA